VDKVLSPDIPAYYCYLLVAGIALLVSSGKVNDLMASSPRRWGFLSTWLVFGAYSAVPVALFWFLDYTGTLHDTSLLSALLVAFGYRQIITGQTKSVALPAEVSSLWNPFEAWANKVRDRIVTKAKSQSDKFDEKVRNYLAQDPQRIAGLMELAYSKTADREQLAQKINTLQSAGQPAGLDADGWAKALTRLKVDACLDALRLAAPEQWGHLLLQHRIIGEKEYSKWISNYGEQITLWVGLGVIAALIIAGFFMTFSPTLLVPYHQWRFEKGNSTDVDRFRAGQFLLEQAKSTKDQDTLRTLLNPLIRWLTYRNLDDRVARETLSLVLDLHRANAANADTVTVPTLIDALVTENVTIRGEINDTLKSLWSLGYAPPNEESGLTKWTPSKNDIPSDVLKRIEAYHEWWDKQPKRQ
jgi:hypothetical protein